MIKTTFSILLIMVFSMASPAVSLGISEKAPDIRPANVLTVPVFFRPANATEKEQRALDKMVRSVKADPSLTIEVTGHTDTLGSEEENLAIGFHYALNIADKLERTYDLGPGSVKTVSRGESEARIASGDYLQQTANRRVEIRLGRKVPEESLTSTRIQQNRSRYVIILEPSSGEVDRAYQRVRAIVEGESSSALLIVNGISSLISVQNSRVEGEAVLKKGKNTIEIISWNEGGAYGKDTVTVTYKPPPPRVKIEAPRDGQVFNTTESPVIEVRGRVKSTSPLRETFLFLNGSPRRIATDRDGRFAQQVVLIRESNSLRVEALDTAGKTDTSREIKVATINMSPKDIVIFLTWDKPGVDLDLHVWGPGSTHTYYEGLDPFENRSAIPNGALDIDDQDGYGPEVFTLANGRDGNYIIEAVYHYSPKGEPCQAKVTVVLNPADPARRLTRVFGPRTMGPGARTSWDVTWIKLPEGKFLE